MNITEALSRKGSDIDAITARVLENPAVIEEMINGIQMPKSTLRYGYEKVLRKISEREPERIYPYFDLFPQIENRGPVIAFVENCLANTRKQVVKKAESFLEKRGK